MLEIIFLIRYRYHPIQLFENLGIKDFQIELQQTYSISNHLHWLTTGERQENTDIGYRFTFPGIIKDPAFDTDLHSICDELDNKYRELLIRHGYSDMVMATIKGPY